MPWIILFGGILVGTIRFGIPGHDLSWAGTYEAMAHIWVGAVLTVMFGKGYDKGDRRFAAWALFVVTIVEVIAFLNR